MPYSLDNFVYKVYLKLKFKSTEFNTSFMQKHYKTIHDYYFNRCLNVLC